jgi:ribosomal protein S18 acetylase RimI-like enzyme
MRIEIRRATSDDASRATEIARTAKAHWGYPADWLAAWENDLTIRESDIERHPTFVASLEGEVVGVCQIQRSAEHAFLEHVWVDPRAHRQGVGRALVEYARAESPGVLAIVADPYAEPFYLRLGARRVGEVAAPMPGAPDRMLPLLELDSGR